MHVSELVGLSEFTGFTICNAGSMGVTSLDKECCNCFLALHFDFNDNLTLSLLCNEYMEETREGKR